jgi:hypothetical protein
MALTLEQQRANLESAKAEQADQYGFYDTVDPKTGQLIGHYKERPFLDTLANLFPGIAPSPLYVQQQREKAYQVPGSPENVWARAYSQKMGGGTSQAPLSPFGGRFSAQTFGDPFLATGVLDMSEQPPVVSPDASIDSSVPLSATNANNRAQQGDKDSKSLQEAYESVMKSQQNAAAMGFGTLGKDEQGKQTYTEGGGQDLAAAGFNREPGRRYAVERDTAGNVIGMQALGKHRAGGMSEDITREELQAKSWKAKGSEGGAGSPFTPNLDKFKARQDPNLLAATMAGQNPSDLQQMDKAMDVAKKFTIPAMKEQQIARDAETRSTMIKMGINPDTKESMPGLPAGWTQKTATLDTSADAAKAMQDAREKADPYFDVATDLSKGANDIDKARRDRMYREGQTRGMSTMKDYQDVLAARDARKGTVEAVKQYGKEIQAGANESGRLSSIPKTTITETQTPYGQAYTSPTALNKKTLDEAKKKKIFEGGNA